MALRLKLVTPTRQLVDEEVSEVTAPGSQGEFGVLAEHTTFLGALGTGVLSYVCDGRRRQVVVYGGYGEVDGDIITVVADGAEFAEDIDGPQAREELAEAHRRLQAGAEDPDEVARLVGDLRRAEVRVEALG
ncbi:MAG: ATP synthase F1 subunit epsilon [Deltaproteobacteria bacterium]